MKSCGTCEACNSLGLLLTRLLPGAALLVGGYLQYKAGVQAYVSDHAGEVESFVSPKTADVYLHAVPYAMMALGGMLTLGLLTRVGGLLAAALLVTLAWPQGGVDGLFFRPLEASSTLFAGRVFKGTFVYGVLGLVSVLMGPGKLSLDALLFRRRKEITVRDDRLPVRRA